MFLCWTINRMLALCILIYTSVRDDDVKCGEDIVVRWKLGLHAYSLIFGCTHCICISLCTMGHMLGTWAGTWLQEVLCSQSLYTPSVLMLVHCAKVVL